MGAKKEEYRLTNDTLQELKVEIGSESNFKIQLCLPQLNKCSFAFFQKHNFPFQFELQSRGPLKSKQLIIEQMQ